MSNTTDGDPITQTQSADVPVSPSRTSRVPTTDNPGGYPAYHSGDILSYTNRQIRYYMHQNAIPATQIATFTKAVENRRRVLAALGQDGDTEDENGPDSIPAPIQSPPLSAPRQAEAPRTTTLTYDNDSEPDTDYPTPQPGLKGIRIDDRIVELKADGGLANFNRWLGSLCNAFTGDPNRFTTGGSRILLAIAHTEETLQSLHAASANKHPLLRTHWRKFIRWIKENNLYGTADHTLTLDKWMEMRQKPNQAPAYFCNRLVVLAAELDKVVTQDELLPRLQQGLKNTLIRNNRQGHNINELVHNAQEIWGTFGRHNDEGRKESDRPPRNHVPPPALKNRNSFKSVDRTGSLKSLDQRSRQRYLSLAKNGNDAEKRMPASTVASRATARLNAAAPTAMPPLRPALEP